MRNIFVILVLLGIIALANATAPAWVTNGTVLTYTVSTGQTITYTVLARNGAQIEIQESGVTGSVADNASAQSGIFWYDNSTLSSSYVGAILTDGVADSGWTVANEANVSFAGQTWDAYNLTGTIQGAQTTELYDKNTGLLLYESVEDDEATPPVIQSEMLTQKTIPSLVVAPPPPPPPTPAPVQQNVTTPTPTPTTQVNTSTTSTTATTTEPTTAPVTDNTPTTTATSAPSSNCCPSTIGLLLLSVGVLYKRKN